MRFPAHFCHCRDLPVPKHITRIYTHPTQLEGGCKAYLHLQLREGRNWTSGCSYRTISSYLANTFSSGKMQCTGEITPPNKINHTENTTHGEQYNNNLKVWLMTVRGPMFPSQQKIGSYFKEKISHVTLYESLRWHMGLYKVV